MVGIAESTWGEHDGPRKIEYSMQQNAGSQNADETVWFSYGLHTWNKSDSLKICPEL